MKKLNLFLALFLIILQTTAFAVTRYWVGGATGNYSVSANWNTQPNGTGSFGAPINTDDLVIRSNTTITIDGNYAPSSLWIENNAVVNFTTSASRTYTIGGGSVSPAFKIEAGSSLNIQGTAAIVLAMYNAAAEIYGVLDFSGTSSKMNYENGIGSGTTTIKTGGKIRYGGNSSNGTGSRATFFMDAGSTYEVYKNGGSFPTGTYHPQSLVLNSGAVANPALFLMNASVGSYGNYEFNSPSNANSTIGFNQNLSFNDVHIVNDGSGKWVYSTSTINGYTLNIDGNLTIESGAIFDVNRAASGSWTCVILVKGNVSVSGELTESGANTESVLELGGSSSSTINLVSNAISNDISLKINKLGGIVLALSDVNLPSSLNSKLIFNSGCINTKIYNKMVYVANPSSFSVLNGSANSHIVGILKRKTNQIFASYDFPVSNNETQWAKATIVPNATDVTDWTVEFITPNSSANTGLIPGVIDVISNYYWNISRSGLSNIANLSLYYNGLSNSTVAIPNQLKILRKNNTGWQNLGGNMLTGGVENNLGTSGGAAPLDPISDFGQFALGGVINTLPVSLNYFQGKKNSNGNELSWKVNCTGVEGLNFSLERSSDGLIFTEIHQQYASAVACRDAFSFTDISSKSTRNYYRLFIKDSDGNKQYSQVVLLENKTTKGILNLYPNPVFIENCRVELMAEKSGKGRISLVSLMGVKVVQQDYMLMQGKNMVTLPVQKLSAGVYNVIFTDDEGYTTSAPLVIE